MGENPYASPEYNSPVVGVLSGRREDLRIVASSQKGVLVCILLQILFVVGQFAFPPELRYIPNLCVLVVAIAGAVYVFKLAIKVYGMALGIVCGILALIPCIGLITLLVVNQKATSILNRNGIKVGLMGADVSSI